MELTDSQQLSFLVENLTTSGKKDLDKPNLKKLKSMCKRSDEHLEQTFRLLFTQLEKDHSEIRLAVVTIIDELFQRSHLFRELLLENFNDFLELAAGTNFDMPLPDPRTTAAELMKKAVRCVHAWNEKYGPAYKKLVIGFNFLRSTKKLQMVNADEVQTQIQRNALEERRRRKNERNAKKLEKLTKDIDSAMPEIVSCNAEMEACFTLLVSKFQDCDDEVNLDTVEAVQSNGYDRHKRESGIVSLDYNLQLDLSEDVLCFVKIQENEDNEAVLQNLRDRDKVLRNVHLPRVKKWLAHLGMCGAPAELLKQIIDLKTTIMMSFQKSKDLIVMQGTTQDEPSTSGLNSAAGGVDSDDTSDDDFEEVIEKPKLSPSRNSEPLSEKHEAKRSNKRSSDTSVWKPLRCDDNLADPTSYSRALAVQNEQLKILGESQVSEVQPSKLVKVHPKAPGVKNRRNMSERSKQFFDAPVVPFGPDLLEWDQEKKQELKETLAMGRAKELDIGHRFWSGDSATKGDSVSEAALTALTTRSIAFTGEFEPVKLSCRAPLPSGKLCSRKDRVKCPFHGKIIPRDKSGCPTNPEHKSTSGKVCKNDDWQDPALLRELEAITGIDLKMPVKKAKKRKRATKTQYENLTDVKTLKDNSRYRLQKKVLDPKSRKRVSETLDKIDDKRNFQKFGNNFNYALN